MSHQVLSHSEYQVDQVHMAFTVFHWPSCRRTFANWSDKKQETVGVMVSMWRQLLLIGLLLHVLRFQLVQTLLLLDGLSYQLFKSIQQSLSLPRNCDLPALGINDILCVGLPWNSANANRCLPTKPNML